MVAEMPNVTRDEFLQWARIGRNNQAPGTASLQGAAGNGRASLGLPGDLRVPLRPSGASQPTRIPERGREIKVLSVRSQSAGQAEMAHTTSLSLEPELRIPHATRPSTRPVELTASGRSPDTGRYYQGAPEEPPPAPEPPDPCKPPEKIEGEVESLLSELFVATNENDRAKKRKAVDRLLELLKQCPDIVGRLLRDAEKQAQFDPRLRREIGLIFSRVPTPAELLRRILETRSEEVIPDGEPTLPELPDWEKPIRKTRTETTYMVSGMAACIWIPMIEALGADCRKEAAALLPRLEAICESWKYEEDVRDPGTGDGGKSLRLGKAALAARVGLSSKIEDFVSCLEGVVNRK